MPPGEQNRFDAELARRRSGDSGAPANRFEAELARRAQEGGPEARPSFTGVASEMAGRRLANSILRTPAATGDLLAMGSAGVQGAGRMIRGQAPRFTETYHQEQERFPASALRAIPSPTVQEISAAVKSMPSLLPGGEKPGDAFDRNLAEIEAHEQSMRQARPGGAWVGDVAGDIATLLLGRQPVSGTIRRSEQRIAGMAKPLPEVATAKDVLNSAIRSGPMQWLLRTTGRTAETGAEAVVLDVLKDPEANPMETFAFAGGAQAAGSALQSVASSRAGAGLLGAVAATTVFMQMTDTVTPGGNDYILPNIEGAFDSVALFLAAGALSAAGGAGRMFRDKNVSENFGYFLDSLATAHRGVGLSLLTDYTQSSPSEKQTYQSTMERLMQEPDWKGDSELEQSIVSRLRNSVGRTKGVIDRNQPARGSDR